MTTLIEPLHAGDIADCDTLVIAAGWNQLQADWSIMLEIGSGECIRDPAGRAVATAIVLPYGPFAWISMVLVDPAHRGRGHATALLKSAIAKLAAQGSVPVLDATAAGRKVYLPLGFTGGPGITRWRGEGRARTSQLQALGAKEMSAAVQMDRSAFGACRGVLLNDFASRHGALSLSDVEGYLFARSGRTATQIGPIVASDGHQAIRLLEAALDSLSGQVLIDVHAGRDAVERLLRANSFVLERSFERMCLGPSRYGQIDKMTHAIAGPEYG